MGSTPAVWLVLAVALVAANLPFVNERLLLVGPRRSPRRSAGDCSSCCCCGALTLGLGFALEARERPAPSARLGVLRRCAVPVRHAGVPRFRLALPARRH